MNDAGIQLILNELQQMKNRQDGMYELLKAVEHRGEETSAEVAAIIENLSYLKGEMTAIKSDISGIKEKLANIEMSQDKSEKILGTLAVRTLLHEAEIKELKIAK
ncbi:MAG: hypothetical protein PHC60_04040 [Heliobacteriaceae bacterium]|nr:hypothetical protein [Heliobacteriaceae bacterium]